MIRPPREVLQFSRGVQQTTYCVNLPEGPNEQTGLLELNEISLY
jgi:hypothetical protein